MITVDNIEMVDLKVILFLEPDNCIFYNFILKTVLLTPIVNLFLCLMHMNRYSIDPCVSVTAPCFLALSGPN